MAVLLPTSQLCLSAVTVALIVFIVTSYSVIIAYRDVTFLLDLDDKENFILHPFLNEPLPKTFPHMYELASTPILGVVEPVSAFIRLLIVSIVGKEARSLFLMGCFLHALNALQLVFILFQMNHVWFNPSSVEMVHFTTKKNSPASPITTKYLEIKSMYGIFSVSCCSLLWGLHPLRGEVVGWLSCQSYLFATFFCFLSVITTLKRSASKNVVYQRLNHFWSLFFFILACGCKAVVVTLPCYLVLLRVLSEVSFSLTRLSYLQKASSSQIGKTKFFMWTKLLTLVLKTCFFFSAHFLVSFYVIYTTHIVNIPSTNSEHEEKSDVSADAGLFWEPVSLSLPSRILKGLFSSLFFYPMKIIYPVGLRILYLTPRFDENEPSMRSELRFCLLFCSLFVVIISVLIYKLGISKALMSRNNKIVLALKPTPADHISQNKNENDENHRSSTSDEASMLVLNHKNQLNLTWILFIVIMISSWFLLLLPTLGFTPHGWTLIGADRYTYLPHALSVTPFVHQLHQFFVSKFTWKDNSHRFHVSIWCCSWLCLILCLSISLQPHLSKWSSSPHLWASLVNCHIAPFTYNENERSLDGAIVYINGKDKDDMSDLVFDEVMNIASKKKFVLESIMSMGYEGVVYEASAGQKLNRVIGSQHSPVIKSWPLIGSNVCPDVIALYNFARILQTSDRHGAVSIYLKAVRSDPYHGGAWNNLGSLIQARYGTYGDIHSLLSGVIFDAYFTLLKDHVDNCVTACEKFNPSNQASNIVKEEDFPLCRNSDSDTTAFEFGSLEYIHNTNNVFRKMLSKWRSSGPKNDIDEHRSFFIKNEVIIRSILAEICFRVAIRLNPNTHSTAYNNLGKLLHTQAHSFLFLNMFDPDCKVTATLHYSSNKSLPVSNVAMRSYEKAINISSTYSKAWFNLGLLQLKQQSDFDTIHVSLDLIGEPRQVEVDQTRKKSTSELLSLVYLNVSTSYLLSLASFSDISHSPGDCFRLNLKLSNAMISFQQAYKNSEETNINDVLVDSCLKLGDLLLKSNIVFSHENEESLKIALTQLYSGTCSISSNNEENRLVNKDTTTNEQSIVVDDFIFNARKNLQAHLRIDILIEALSLFEKANRKSGAKDINLNMMIQFVQKQIKDSKKKLKMPSKKT